MTSYAMADEAARATAAGGDGYVSKPFSPRSVLALVRRFLPQA